MSIDPSDVLKDARRAVQEKNYRLALEKYQWFYEHALDFKKSLYGVRLSYCLAEWSYLGDIYPEAKLALLELKKREKDKFDKTLEREAFHEYSSIAEYLGQQEEAFNCFILIANSNKELAYDLFTYVYDYCASNGKWELCYEFLGDAVTQYATILDTFDHMDKFFQSRKPEIDESFIEGAIESFKQQALWIFYIIRAGGTSSEYDRYKSRLKSDLSARGFSELYQSIIEDAPKPND